MTTRLFLPFGLPLAAALLVTACGPSISDVNDPSQGTGGERVLCKDGETRVGRTLPTDVDLMGWGWDQRAKLSLVRDGALAVRLGAEGCNLQLEVLDHCLAPVNYEFVSYAVTESKIVHDRAELSTKLPLGVAELSGRLSTDNALRADYMVAGILSTPAGVHLQKGDLRGPDCGRATHIVTRVYLGGFAMSSGKRREIDAGANAFNVQAGGKTSSSLDVFHDELDDEACAHSQQTKTPNDGCSVPLRIGLLPVSGANALPCDGEQDCKSACHASDAQACALLADHYANGTGGAKQDKALQRKYADMACSGGHEYACVGLGEIYENGDGVRVDVQRAGYLYDQACRGGIPDGCLPLGDWYRDGLYGIVKDPTRAVQYYGSACRGGLTYACGEALKILEPQCADGIAIACGELGNHHMYGWGVASDARRALQFFDQSCAGNDGMGCLAAATTLSTPTGTVRPDPARASAYYARACELGVTQACGSAPPEGAEPYVDPGSAPPPNWADYEEHAPPAPPPPPDE